MAIDYSIPLGIKPVQMQSPMNTLGKLYEFRAMRDDQEARRIRAEQERMQLEQMHRAEGDRQTLARAYSAPKLTRQSAIEAVQKAGAGHLVPIINKQFDDWDEAALKRKEALDKAAQAEQGYLGRLFQGVEQNGYDPMAALAAIDHAEATFGEAFKPKADALREQFLAAGDDPAKVRAIVEGIQRQDPNFHQRQTAEASESRARTAADTLTANKPKLEAEARAAALKTASQELAATGSQAAYEAVRNGLPFAIARLFPDKYNRDEVLKRGLSPNEAMSDADRDASRAQTGAIAERTAKISERHATVAERNADRLAAGGPNSLSPEAKATAERWKANQLAELRTKWPDYNERNNLTGYEAEELRIENEYRAQVGLPRVETLPWRSDARTVTGPRTPGGTGRLGDLVPPPATTATTTAARPTTIPGPPMRPTRTNTARDESVPADVQAALKGEKPGRYEGEDGRVFEVKRDGTIIRIK